MDSKESSSKSECSSGIDITESERFISTPSSIRSKENIFQTEICPEESDVSEDTNDDYVECFPCVDSSTDSLNIEENFNYSIERYLDFDESGAAETPPSPQDDGSPRGSSDNRKRPRSGCSSNNNETASGTSHDSSSVQSTCDSSLDITSCDSSILVPVMRTKVIRLFMMALQCPKKISMVHFWLSLKGTIFHQKL